MSANPLLLPGCGGPCDQGRKDCVCPAGLGITPRTERSANVALADTNETTRRFFRSLAEAFPDERASAGTHYVSHRMRHRLMRAVRRLVSWLLPEHPPRALTAMQARGEVMEPSGCASPTGRGGDAAPARAVGPVFIGASQAGPASDGSQKPNGRGLSCSTAPARAGSKAT